MVLLRTKRVGTMSTTLTDVPTIQDIRSSISEYTQNQITTTYKTLAKILYALFREWYHSERVGPSVCLEGVPWEDRWMYAKMHLEDLGWILPNGLFQTKVANERWLNRITDVPYKEKDHYRWYSVPYVVTFTSFGLWARECSAGLMRDESDGILPYTVTGPWVHYLSVVQKAVHSTVSHVSCTTKGYKALYWAGVDNGLASNKVPRIVTNTGEYSYLFQTYPGLHRLNQFYLDSGQWHDLYWLHPGKGIHDEGRLMRCYFAYVEKGHFGLEGLFHE